MQRGPGTESAASGYPGLLSDLTFLGFLAHLPPLWLVQLVAAVVTSRVLRLSSHFGSSRQLVCFSLVANGAPPALLTSSSRPASTPEVCISPTQLSRAWWGVENGGGGVEEWAQ